MINLLFAAPVCPKENFFGLVPWYKYLDYGPSPIATGGRICEVKNFQVLGSGSDFPLILLALVDNLLRIAGLLAVGFIIYGAIKYVTSQGSPDDTSQAQNTIVNALIGLVVAMIGVGLVSFIGGRFN